ncbi:hypothetical protein NHX12_005694 [Muraenolepis orangiensis]|uniref:Uncharacterized protein n=1 Tax=Muraenolepis orangiensis TaxID=630683 RepID=A0A9Q0DPR4_9TELE|nr:hypothetical protein NHX12_005694 [Muraenolepis orangiensis]
MRKGKECEKEERRRAVKMMDRGAEQRDGLEHAADGSVKGGGVVGIGGEVSTVGPCEGEGIGDEDISLGYRLPAAILTPPPPKKHPRDEKGEEFLIPAEAVS